MNGISHPTAQKQEKGKTDSRQSLVMSGTQLGALLSILFTAGFLAGAWAIRGEMVGTVIAILLGAGWAGSLTWRRVRISNSLFILTVFFCAVSVYFSIPTIWLLAAIIAALTAWDLESFAQRMDRAGRVDDRSTLVRHHLTRLLMVDLLGFILGAVALGVQLSISFGIALLLAILIILGITPVVAYLRRTNP